MYQKKTKKCSYKKQSDDGNNKLLRIALRPTEICIGNSVSAKHGKTVAAVHKYTETLAFSAYLCNDMSVFSHENTSLRNDFSGRKNLEKSLF